MVFRPWLNDRIYAPYKLSALVETLVDLGVSPSETLQGTGICVGELDDVQTRTSVGQYLAACRNAVRLVPDPITPFLVGRKMHLSAYGMYGYTLMSSLTLRDFFDEGVKYHGLATPMVVIEWREEAGAAIWSFPRLASPELSADLHRFLFEQQLMQHAVHLKDVAGASCRPIKASLSYPKPAHADHYAHFLECPVIFDAEACELHFDASILERPTQLAHKLTSSLMQATCERMIGQARTSAGTSGQVYQIVIAMPGRLPTLSEVASTMQLHERTLRRKLESEGTSFGDIIDEVRASLAIEYLRTTKMRTDDIATLVGFSEAANFRRAFKRWTGKAPSDFRH